MKVARHWIRETVESLDARGRKLRTAAWGWSASTAHEARQRARASAERVLAWLADPKHRDHAPHSAQYSYLADRPPREEILQEFHDGAGEPLALISRNGYGSLVLNARDLMFIDVDIPRPLPGFVRLLSALFGIFKSPSLEGRGQGRDASPVSQTEEEILERIRAWCAARPLVGLRLYRTAAGFRACLVDRPRQAHDDESRAILDQLGADPLYRRLCEAQECFRARLTPKPWRIGLHDASVRYPYLEPAAAELHRDWLAEYDAAAPSFATCRLVETHGPREIHPDLAALVILHDTLTASEQPLPLA